MKDFKEFLKKNQLNESQSSNVYRTIEQVVKYTKEEDGDEAAKKLFELISKLTSEYMDVDRFKDLDLSSLSLKAAMGDAKAAKDLNKAISKMTLDGALKGLKKKGVTIGKTKSREDVAKEATKLINALMQ